MMQNSLEDRPIRYRTISNGLCVPKQPVNKPDLSQKRQRTGLACLDSTLS